MLDPLLDSVEKAIPQSQHLTWATMELEDLYTLLRASAQTQAAMKKCSNAVESLLGLMLAIQKTAQANKVTWLATVMSLHLVHSGLVLPADMTQQTSLGKCELLW